MRRAALGVICWLCLPSCTISAVSEAEDSRRTNSCDADSDCDDDVESCKDGLCQPKNGELEALLIEVTPPSDSMAAHLSFVSHLEAVPTSGGPLKQLPPVRSVKVSGNLHLPTPDTCYPILPQEPVPQPKAENLSLPVSVTLIPRERLLGLPQQVYVTAGTYRLDGTYRFVDLEVPPGDYDVYMVPDRGQRGECVVPPQLFRGETIKAPTATLDYPASKSSTLNLRITWPKGPRTLDGWTADIIEPLGGKPISSEVKLGTPSDRGDSYQTVDYGVPLVYSTVSLLRAVPEATESARDLVRLRPPEGDATPTIFLERSALGLLSDTPIVNGFTRYPDPVTVEGQLASGEDGRPLVGSVVVVSTEIFGVDEGILASFQARVQVAEKDDGVFSLAVPPGKYRVHAVPDLASVSPDSRGALSALVTSWEIAAGTSPQAGKLLELSRSSAVTGQSWVEGAEVRVAPSPQTVLPFQEALGAGPFIPRGRNALVDAGRFAVSVDPGRLDISLRPPEELGYPWYVKPGVDVLDEDHDLGPISPKAPSVLRGITTWLFESDERDPVSHERVVVTQPIGHCSVRAYAYLDKDLAYTRVRASAVSVVQVAETRSDETGAFRLLVPSSLAGPK